MFVDADGWCKDIGKGVYGGVVCAETDHDGGPVDGGLHLQFPVVVMTALQRHPSLQDGCAGAEAAVKEQVGAPLDSDGVRLVRGGEVPVQPWRGLRAPHRRPQLHLQVTQDNRL